jgi:hypothetical protein
LDITCDKQEMFFKSGASQVLSITKKNLCRRELWPQTSGNMMTYSTSQPLAASTNQTNSSITTNQLSVTRLLLAASLLATLSFGLSCSGNNPAESGSIGKIPVTVTPISGPPLTSVRVLGLDSMNVDFSDTYAYFNGVLTPLFVSDSGKVSVTVPAIVDSATMWIDTSITTMSLVIVRSTTGDTAAIGKDVFTLEALLPAPGSVTQMMTDWGTISASWQTISQILDGGPGAREQICSALLSALDSLINGSDSLSLKSLTARVTAGNPQELALLDALFGSSGVAEQSQKYAVMFQAMADSATILLAGNLNRGVPVPSVITDKQLAFAMQFYIVVREFGRTVIAPTAQTYAIVTGAIGLVGNIPIASVISASLSVIDFIVNKYVVSLLPAKIDSLRISLTEDTIFVSEQTNSQVMIYASNDPQAITFNDLVAQILNGLGLTASVLSPRELNSLVDLFTNVANYMVGLLQTGVSSYAGSHPELNLDFTVTTMPQLRWKAQIVDTKFIDLKTHTPTIINPISGVVNWKADASTTGEGRIYAVTVASGATVIPQPAGFAYSGGAFGEDVAGAPAVSVWSLKKMAMVIDFAPTITAGGANVLSVTAGSFDGAGKLVPEGGTNIVLLATGGVAAPATGVTDATGQFSSVITLNPMTDTVTVQVTASKTSTSTTAKDTVSAATQSGTSRIAYASYRDGGPGIWSVNPNDTSDVIKLCTVQPIEPSPFPVRGIYWSRDSKWLLYSMSGFFGRGIYTTGGTGASFQRTILDPRSYKEATAPSSQSWFSGVLTEFLVGANHRRISADRGQYIGASSGGKQLVSGSSARSRRPMFISPDDQKVASVGGCGLGVTCLSVIDANNIASGATADVVGPIDANGQVRIKFYGWTVDGSSLIYVMQTNSSSGGYVLKLVNSNGTNTRTLTSGSGTVTFVSELPGKNALAILTSHPTGNNSTLDNRLAVVTMSGGVTSIPVSQSSIIDISSSPDGEYVAFGNAQRPQRIHKINLTTRVETVLVTDSLSISPAWSGFILQ